MAPRDDIVFLFELTGSVSVVSSQVLYGIETTAELDMRISSSPTLQSHHPTSSVQYSIMYPSTSSSSHWVSPTLTSELLHYDEGIYRQLHRYACRKVGLSYLCGPCVIVLYLPFALLFNNNF